VVGLVCEEDHARVPRFVGGACLDGETRVSPANQKATLLEVVFTSRGKIGWAMLLFFFLDTTPPLLLSARSSSLPSFWALSLSSSDKPSLDLSTLSLSKEFLFLFFHRAHLSFVLTGDLLAINTQNFSFASSMTFYFA